MCVSQCYRKRVVSLACQYLHVIVHAGPETLELLPRLTRPHAALSPGAATLSAMTVTWSHLPCRCALLSAWSDSDTRETERDSMWVELESYRSIMSRPPIGSGSCQSSLCGRLLGSSSNYLHSSKNTARPLCQHTVISLQPVNVYTHTDTHLLHIQVLDAR